MYSLRRPVRYRLAKPPWDASGESPLRLFTVFSPLTECGNYPLIVRAQPLERFPVPKVDQALETERIRQSPISRLNPEISFVSTGTATKKILLKSKNCNERLEQSFTPSREMHEFFFHDAFGKALTERERVFLWFHDAIMERICSTDIQNVDRERVWLLLYDACWTIEWRMVGFDACSIYIFDVPCIWQSFNSCLAPHILVRHMANPDRKKGSPNQL